MSWYFPKEDAVFSTEKTAFKKIGVIDECAKKWTHVFQGQPKPEEQTRFEEVGIQDVPTP